MSRTHRGRLFRKYFLLILGFVCGALLLSGGTSLYFSYQENKEALANLQQEKAVGAAARIEQFVSQIEQQLAFAALPQLGADGLEQRRIEFLKLLRVVPAVTDIAQIDGKGREQLAVSRLKMDTAGANEDRSQEPAFKNARPGQTWYGPVYFRKETEPYMSIAVRSGGESGPVTVAEVNLKFIWDVVSRIRIGQKGKAYVVDATGHLVADPDIGLVLRKTSLSQLEQVKAAFAPGADESQAMLANDLAGNPVLTAYAPIEPAREQARGGSANPLGWKVFVEQPVSEVYAALDATILRTVALIVAGLLFSALAALWLARSMVRPIGVLQQGAARIGAGDLEQQIDVRTGDELQALAEQFNRMTAQLRESYAGLERKVEARTAELTESLAYQTATGQILQVISSSPTDVQPVFQVIAERAARLCEAEYGWVFTFDGEWIRIGSVFGSNPRSVEVLSQEFPMRASTGQAVVARTVREAEVVHVADVLVEAGYALKQAADLAGFRGALGVPMMREGQVVGAITVARATVGLFTDKRVELLKTFASQAVIAIENVRLFNETTEALERQTATSEILRVISSSTTDVQPVLEAIVRSAAQLFAQCNAFIFMREGDLVQLRAMEGVTVDQPLREELARIYPVPFDPATSTSARAMAERRMNTCLDTESPEVPDHIRRAGRAARFRSNAVVPLVRDDEGIGTIVLTYPEPGFTLTEKELELLRTFADQAVIAIENVRLFNETKESLERQTATAEILRVISSTPTDTQPVFDAIVQASDRLIPGAKSALLIRKGTRFVLAAFSHPVETLPEEVREAPLDPEQNFPSRTMVRAEVVHVPDWDAEDVPEFEKRVGKAYGIKSGVLVPLLRKGVGVGALAVTRATSGKFAKDEIALLQSFADQAVIAIENVRLFNETKEALERQTATSDILKVISSSTTDVQPVFESIVQSGLKLYPDAAVVVSLPENGEVRLAAIAHQDPELSAQYRSRFPFPLTREYMHGIALLERRMVDVPDAHASADPSLATGMQNFLASGFRAMTVMPMLRGEGAIGAISVVRRAPGPLSDKQLALLRTFADQAVIAIENVRLFNETKDALERQTATSDILGVISSSTTDVQPVFDAIVRNAVKLCDAMFANAFRYDGEMLHFLATTSGNDAFLQTLKDVYPMRPEASQVAGRAVLTRAVQRMEDALADPEYERRHALAGGWRRMLGVPLLRDGNPIGVIVVGWESPGPIPAVQEQLLKTFADQAVIAVENVRLFNETREGLERQTATSDILRVISDSPGDVKPILDAVAERATRLCETASTAIYVLEGEHMRRAAFSGQAKLKGRETVPYSGGTLVGRAVVEGKPIHVHDIEQAQGEYPLSWEFARQYGRQQTMLAVPLLREGRPFGTMFLRRSEVRPFNERQIALAKVFADQAAIGIENVRLFEEIREKSAQLEIANKHKSEFLANMSHELRTPLNAIIGFSEVLSERMFGEINEKQADYLKDIHESGKHLLSLINDILDLSKIEAGRMELELSTFDLPSALSNAMTLVRERAQRHGIELSLAVDGTLGAFQGDERKFKQIMLNLLSNAVKFTPDGGRVAVAVKNGAGQVEIAVRDTGIGIAPEDHAAVFEEFKQVGRDYTRKAEGTGLGLALTKRFVELHGGEIRLESAAGKGSTFTVSLPIRP